MNLVIQGFVDQDQVAEHFRQLVIIGFCFSLEQVMERFAVIPDQIIAVAEGIQKAGSEARLTAW